MGLITLFYILAAIILFIIILTGVIAALTGKPYNIVLLSFHKITAFAGAVIIIIFFIKNHAVMKIGFSAVLTSVICGCFFIAAFITGVIISSRKTMDSAGVILHKITSVLLAVSYAAALCMLILNK